MAGFKNLYNLHNVMNQAFNQAFNQAPRLTDSGNQAFVDIENLAFKVHKLTEYNQINQKCTINHIITNTLQSHRELIKILKSFALELDVRPDFETHNEIEFEAQCDLLRNESNATVNTCEITIKQLKLKPV